VPLLAGSYDLRLTYDHDNVKAKGSITAFAVGGNHGIQKKTFRSPSNDDLRFCAHPEARAPCSGFGNSRGAISAIELRAEPL